MWAHPLTSMGCRISADSLNVYQVIQFAVSEWFIHEYIKTSGQKTSNDLCPALPALLTCTSFAPCVYSPAWHDTRKQHRANPLTKGTKYPPSCSSSTAHPPFFFCQATTQDCHNRKDMWVPFLNPTLFCIIKRKRICHGPLCLLYGSLVVWGTHVTLRHREREQGWESLPNPPPSALWSTEAWRGLQSTPTPPPPAH